MRSHGHNSTQLSVNRIFLYVAAPSGAAKGIPAKFRDEIPSGSPRLPQIPSNLCRFPRIPIDPLRFAQIPLDARDTSRRPLIIVAQFRLMDHGSKLLA